MPPPADDPVCAKFQPNVFDPSRCHDCLRQKHSHAGAGPPTEAGSPASGKEIATGMGNRTRPTNETRTVTAEEEVSPLAVEVGDTSGRKEVGLEEGANRWRLKVDPGWGERARERERERET